MVCRNRTLSFARFRTSLAAIGGLGLLGSSLLGQTPARPTPVTEDLPSANAYSAAGVEFEQVEHLTRGPLHEAFAEPYEADPRPAPIVPTQPPEPINEVPPEYRPDGENVVWIPGYWSWDDDRTDYIWVSGVWRDVPPEHQWVPGYWTRTSGGFQYISGFWASNQVAEIEYLPPPPDSLEQGPSSPAPGDAYFYIPGHWVYNGHDYAWQPGYWSLTQNNWVWVPASYVWTPRGCIYQPGYWDYDIPYRGVVFTPVYYSQPIYRNPRYVYRPRYLIDTGLELFVHLFVRPNRGQYYFGDYYGQRYANSYQPWATFYQGSRYYDPFYTNYRVRGQAGSNLNLLSWIVNQHQLFAQNDRYRPATTIAAQRDFLNANAGANLDQTILRLANLGDSLDSVVTGRDTNVNFQRLTQVDVDRITSAVAPLLELSNQRLRIESSPAANANGNANVRLSLNQFLKQSLEANAAANGTTNTDDNPRSGNVDASARGELDVRQSEDRVQAEVQGRNDQPQSGTAPPQQAGNDATPLPRPQPSQEAAPRKEAAPSKEAVPSKDGEPSQAGEPGKDGEPRPPRLPGIARDTELNNGLNSRDALPTDPNTAPGRSNGNAEATQQPNVQNRPDTNLPSRDELLPNLPRSGDSTGAGNNIPDLTTPDRPLPELQGRENHGDLQGRENHGDISPAQPSRRSDDRTGVLGIDPQNGVNQNNPPSLRRNGNSLDERPLERLNPNDSPNGQLQVPQNREGVNPGAEFRMRPARPENWPLVPRRELGRGVPELPRFRPSESARGNLGDGASAERAPGRSLAPSTPLQVPQSLGNGAVPGLGNGSAPKASGSIQGGDRENKGKGSDKKDKD